MNRFNHLTVEASAEVREAGIWGFFATIVQEGHVDFGGCEALAQHLNRSMDVIVAGATALCSPHIDGGIRQNIHNVLTEDLEKSDLQFAGQLEPDKQAKRAPYWLTTSAVDGPTTEDNWKEAILVLPNGPSIWQINYGGNLGTFNLFMRDFEANQWRSIVIAAPLQHLIRMINAPPLTHMNEKDEHNP